MERQIGEVFEYNGVKLEVIQNSACFECYFCKERIYCGVLKSTILGFCDAYNRIDSRTVIFKEVK